MKHESHMATRILMFHGETALVWKYIGVKRAMDPCRKRQGVYGDWRSCPPLLQIALRSSKSHGLLIYSVFAMPNTLAHRLAGLSSFTRVLSCGAKVDSYP